MIKFINIDEYPIILIGSSIIPEQYNAISELMQIFTSNNQLRQLIEFSNSLDIQKNVSQHRFSLSESIIMQIDQSLFQNSWLIFFIVLLVFTFLFYILYRYNQRQKDIQQQLRQKIKERTLSLTNIINKLNIFQTEILDKNKQLKQKIKKSICRRILFTILPCNWSKRIVKNNLFHKCST